MKKTIFLTILLVGLVLPNANAGILTAMYQKMRLIKAQNEAATIPDISTYYVSTDSIPTGMGETYDKGLEYILNGKINKAYKYFVKLVGNKKVTPELKEHAYYQLAHFDWYNSFDPYYNGIPSAIKREVIQPNMKQKSKYGFEHANDKSCLLMCGNPSFPTYNLEQVVLKGTSFLNSKEYGDRIFGKAIFQSACQSNLINKISLYDLFYEKYYKKYERAPIKGADNVDEQKLLYIVKLTKALPYLSQMRQDGSLPDIGKTAKELYAIAEESYENENYIKAFYYYTRAALFGDVSSLIKIYEVSHNHIIALYNTPALVKYKSSLMEMGLVINEEDLAKGICDCPDFAEFRYITKPALEHATKARKTYFKRQKQEIYAEMAEKEAKKQKRRQFWAGVFQSVAQSMYGVTNQIAYQQSFNAANPQITSTQALNSLLDPRLAMAQVNAQDYARYQSVREAYQRMGQNLSVDEWRAMEGQAIQNMKDQGYDIVNDLQQQNKANKANMQQQHIKESQQRLERNKAILKSQDISAPTFGLR